MIEPGWTTSDLDQWIAVLTDLQFWPYDEEEEAPAKEDARPPAPEFDTRPMMGVIDDDNDILELTTLILSLLEA